MSSTTPTPTARPLSFMKKLGSHVSLYQPSQASSATRSTSTDANSKHEPRLIIIAGWADAKDSHISKYILKYQTLYPESQIVLLKSTMSCILRPSQIGPAMRPAVSVIRAAFPIPAPASPTPFLIHMFSTGGSSSIAKLYEEYAGTAGPDEDKRLPPHVTIFDSCPGLFHIPRAVDFVTVGLSSFQKLILSPFLYLWATLWTGAMALGLIPNLLSDGYNAHNENEGNKAEILRVYVYSAADTLTDHKDVEEHSVEAKIQGFSVMMLEFEGSAHVAHSRQDESRYWNMVRSLMQL